MAVRAGADDARITVIIPTISQASHLEACLASLAVARASSSIDVEVVIVLNGATDNVRAVARAAAGPGVRLIDSAVNRGFGGGCRLGVEQSDAPLFALVNDDVRVCDGWLEPLLETMQTRPQVAAVAPRILGLDGAVQETGSIVWRDGSTRPIGRGAPSSTLAWRWRRRVDYASACALLVRREAWDRVGGFDVGYHPAYYEDVDFCLALAAAGLEVWVDPRSDVVHAESASSSSAFKTFLFARHQARLRERWQSLLDTLVPPPTSSEAIGPAIRTAMERHAPGGDCVLVVDDRVPRHGLGSGFDRMADGLLDLAAAGQRVQVIASEHPAEFSPALAAAGIAVLEGDADALLEEHVPLADVVIASRPNNAARVARVLAQMAPIARRPRVLYDAEALYHRRLARQAVLSTGPEADELTRQGEAWRLTEVAAARSADAIVCVSNEEAEFFRAAGAVDVRVATPWLRQAALTDGSLAGRADIGFVAGWLAGEGSPNADALEWFATEVLPVIVETMPWARVRVTGHLPASLRRFEGPHLRAEGFVSDLAGFYRELRVAVAPLRFGAGVKLKTLEALQHGVPIVATPVGAEGLTGEAAAVVDVHAEPRAFAAAVVDLLLDPGRWRARRRDIERALVSSPVDVTWSGLLAAREAGEDDVVRSL